MSDEIRKLTYEESVCLQMLRYCSVSEYCDLKPSEAKEKLETFFPKEMIADVLDLILNDKEFIVHGLYTF